MLNYVYKMKNAEYLLKFYLENNKQEIFSENLCDDLIIENPKGIVVMFSSRGCSDLHIKKNRLPFQMMRKRRISPLASKMMVVDLHCGNRLVMHLY